jgi:nitrous oxidase accessory protein NosD
MARHIQGLKIQAKPAELVSLNQGLEFEGQFFVSRPINLGAPMVLKLCHAPRMITMVMRD